MKRIRWGMFAFLSMPLLAACGGGGSDGAGGTGGGTGSGTGTTSSSSSSGGSECTSKCVAHETGCGNPSPEGDCEALCTMYQPLAWEITCAANTPCGDMN